RYFKNGSPARCFYCGRAFQGSAIRHSETNRYFCSDECLETAKSMRFGGLSKEEKAAYPKGSQKFHAPFNPGHTTRRPRSQQTLPRPCPALVGYSRGFGRTSVTRQGGADLTAVVWVRAGVAPTSLVGAAKFPSKARNATYFILSMVSSLR